MSPAPPPKSNLAAAAFAKMAAPIFYLTGTADFEPITMAGVKQRRQPFDTGGGSDHYLAIFDGGDHGLFNGRRRLGTPKRATSRRGPTSRRRRRSSSTRT
jgi:hypothetical protein